MRRNRVGVLMGGLSSEREVSLETGEAVLSALLELGYDAQGIFVDRDVDLAVRQAGIDVAFLALHGRYGEDGCIQGLLETMGIPYTGSDVLSSALAMNKHKAKELFRFHNVPTPPYYVLQNDGQASIIDQHGDFGFPVIVKPVSAGSSVGVEVVSNPEALRIACENALCFDNQVLIERWIQGREISVAIVGDRPLGAVEIDPVSSGVYDYNAKHNPGEADYFIPPRLNPQRYRGILAQALRAHQGLGCRGATRVDLIVSNAGNEYVLELNTVPGLTPTSLFPKIANAAGMSFGELSEAILRGASLSGAGRGNGERRVCHREFSGTDRRLDPAPNHH